MLTIGFANTMYTLWNVTPIKNRETDFSYGIGEQCTFLQNLSMNLDEAKKKLSELADDYAIDLELRGEHYQVRKQSVKYEGRGFAFGKYINKSFDEANDVEYTRWYHSETSSEDAKNYLLENGYIEYNDTIMSPEYYANTLEREKRQAELDKLVDGHHFEDGKRIELHIKQVDSFSFDSYYGTCNVITYVNQDGLKFKYMGNGYPDISDTEFIKVKATIAHDNYNDVDETKLKRISIPKK